MTDSDLPGDLPEPTSVMPVTPGSPDLPPTGSGLPPVGPPPGTPLLTPDDDGSGSGQPPWVIPTIVGIVALAIVLLALILTRGDDNDDALPAVDTSTTTIAPETTLEIVGETTPGTTTTLAPETTTSLAPETTIETTVAPTTVAPSTVAPTTVPPPTGPTARPATDLPGNTASLATVDGEQTFAVIGTCNSTPTVGLQAISSVLANESGTVYVVDIYFDEGGDPFIEVADMSESIAGFIYGQDTPGTNSRWNADLPDPNDISQISLVALDGTSDPIGLSINSDEASECGRGFVASPSPFPDAGPIDFIDQFDADVPGDGFAVLAACDGGDTYVTSGGGLIDVFFPTDSGQFSASYFVGFPDDSTFWSTPDGVTPDQQAVFQNGGGGDTDYATQVVNFTDDEVGYLTVRLQPTVTGGLEVVDCPA